MVVRISCLNFDIIVLRTSMEVGMKKFLMGLGVFIGLIVAFNISKTLGWMVVIIGVGYFLWMKYGDSSVFSFAEIVEKGKEKVGMKTTVSVPVSARSGNGVVERQEVEMVDSGNSFSGEDMETVREVVRKGTWNSVKEQDTLRMFNKVLNGDKDSLSDFMLFMRLRMESDEAVDNLLKKLTDEQLNIISNEVSAYKRGNVQYWVDIDPYFKAAQKFSHY